MTVVAGSGWDNFKDAELVGAPDTYVKVSVTGTGSDQRVGPRRSRTSTDVRLPGDGDGARGVAHHGVRQRHVSQDDFLAQYSCPVSMLRPGAGSSPVQRGGRASGRAKTRRRVSW